MKVLVADDDIVIQSLLKNILTDWNYHVLLAKDGLQALQLAEDNPDLQLFIVDWSMPWLDGLAFCQKVKKRDRFAYFIMISGRSGTDNLVAAMDQGVDDFIVKPLVAEELRVRLRVGKKIIEQERRLSYLAQYDELTGIWNRRMVLQWLQNEWIRSQREKTCLSILFIDLDHFKQINDVYGHLVGDEVLRHFCTTVSQQLRPYDYFGRYGGEEFILVLPNTEIQGADVVAERIRKVVQENPLKLDAQRKLSYTVSIGLTVKSAEDTDVKSLIQRADAATYQAKQQGRNRVATLITE
ncbi:GGDEF domain-containing response regulator [Catenovulum sediminis]|uniref:diguanylate cyclase n=1 Tax=Catenovulum sediminis TaxID=1740262 RepID=A0ABV1RMY0_9ALTE